MGRNRDEKERLDELLDAALACTFPASDPVASLSVSAAGGPARPRGEREPGEREAGEDPAD